MVRSHLAQVHLALVDHGSYCAEALALLDFTLSERSAALDWIAQVKAVAVRVGGCRYAVGCKHERVTAVLIAFLSARQFTRNGLNTRGPSYYSHTRAWADTSRDSLLAQFDMAPSCRPALFGRTIVTLAVLPRRNRGLVVLSKKIILCPIRGDKGFGLMVIRFLLKRSYLSRFRVRLDYRLR